VRELFWPKTKTNGFPNKFIIGEYALKFKYLIIIFSIIIILIVLITALLPLLINGNEQQSAVNFKFISLPLLIFMFLLLAGMGIYFLLNYRLLSLLEREDWPALAYYLEQQIIVKGRYDNRKVQLLASSYMVISDYNAVAKLESKALLAKPSVIDKNVLIFGAAKVLSGNHKEAALFFKTRLEKCAAKDKEWVRWFLGFSYLLGGAFALAEPEFTSLAVFSEDALIAGLSAYFLNSSLAKQSLKPDECRATAENGRARVIKVLKNAVNWKKEADKTGTEIHIAIIRKYIDEAGKWLYQL